MVLIRAWSWGTLVGIVALAQGCASVQVIRPVAAQNERNAEALKANTDILLNLVDRLLPALIEVELVNTYRDTILTIRKSKHKPRGEDHSVISAHYGAAGEELRQELAALEPLGQQTRSALQQNCHESYPLAAAVAFSSMSPQRAAAIWLALDQTYDETGSGLTAQEAFCKRMLLVADTFAVRRAEQAKTDILDAYAELGETIATQADNGLVIASQLHEASQTKADPAAFLRGVLENDALVGLIEQTVQHRTRDPERSGAASDLLGSLMDKQAILGMLAGG